MKDDVGRDAAPAHRRPAGTGRASGGTKRSNRESGTGQRSGQSASSGPGQQGGRDRSGEQGVNPRISRGDRSDESDLDAETSL